MRIVQLEKAGGERRVAVVEEPHLCLVREFSSLYALAVEAVARGVSLKGLVTAHVTDEKVAYDAVYEGRDAYRLLPPIDHPAEAACCVISGTGLTHVGSARDRQSMHIGKEEDLTDSMRMFQWGIAQGKPAGKGIGVAPEWFYKGNAELLRAHGEPLLIPEYGEDGGEEAEVAGVYLIGPDARPYRVGMAQGNEFSDHRFEKKNYLNLAGSKLRTCALGPELVIAAEFASVPGRVSLERGGKEFWSKAITTGEEAMSHSLRNLEHHHFKFALHRRPGDLHVHFFGADSLSFGQGVQLEDGDVMQVEFQGFGRALRNPVARSTVAESLVEVAALG